MWSWSKLVWSMASRPPPYIYLYAVYTCTRHWNRQMCMHSIIKWASRRLRMDVHGSISFACRPVPCKADSMRMHASPWTRTRFNKARHLLRSSLHQVTNCCRPTLLCPIYLKLVGGRAGLRDQNTMRSIVQRDRWCCDLKKSIDSIPYVLSFKCVRGYACTHRTCVLFTAWGFIKLWPPITWSNCCLTVTQLTINTTS
jgi:hypothetical protein